MEVVTWITTTLVLQCSEDLFKKCGVIHEFEIILTLLVIDHQCPAAAVHLHNGCRVIKKCADYSTSNNPSVVLKNIRQLWEDLYCNQPIL